MEFYTDDYLIQLSENICNKFNGELRAVNINIQQCKNITDAGFQKFIENI